MKITSVFSLGMLLLSVVITGCAALGTQPRIKAEIVTMTDNTVRLLHLGRGKAGEEFCVGETVPVHRWYAGGRYIKYREVGKVRITGLPDDHSVEGVLMEGEARVGDLARKSFPCREGSIDRGKR